MTDDPQWAYLLQAINRIEARQEKMADMDLQQSHQILELRKTLNDHADKMEAKLQDWEARIKPVENIADRVTAGKTVAIWLFAAFTGLAGLLGAWSVIREWLGK